MICMTFLMTKIQKLMVVDRHFLKLQLMVTLKFVKCYIDDGIMPIREAATIDHFRICQIFLEICIYRD